MAVIEPKNEHVFYRVDPASGKITETEFRNHYPTHAAALEESRRILNFRRSELQEELASIDAALSAS